MKRRVFELVTEKGNRGRVLLTCDPDELDWETHAALQRMVDAAVQGIRDGKLGRKPPTLLTRED